MRSPFISLVAITAKSSLSLWRPTKKGLRDFIRSPKNIAKALGIFLVAIILLAEFGVFFVFMSRSMYLALRESGMQSLMLLNAFLVASVMAFIFGVLAVLSLWSRVSFELHLFSMPLRPQELFGAKIISTYLVEVILSLFMVGIAAVVYGIYEHVGSMFYIQALIAALVLPALPLAIIYFIFVPLMSTLKFFRNKNLVLYIGAVIGMAMGVGFNIYFQRMARSMIDDPTGLSTVFIQPDSLIVRVSAVWPPAWLGMQSLTRPQSLSGIGAALANIALAFCVFAAAAFVLGPSYVRSAGAYQETTLLRRRRASDFSDNTFKGRPVIWSLFMREFRLMNREPIYFLNGPLAPLIMIVMFTFIYFFQRDQFSGITSIFDSMRDSSATYLVPAMLGFFMGSMNNIASTAISRDAKSISWIRSLPISSYNYIVAKFFHAFVFSLIGIVAGVVGGSSALGAGPFFVALAFLLALSATVVSLLLGLYIDMARPKLRWDTPAAAMKQNANAVFATLATLGIAGAFIVVTMSLHLSRYGYALVYGLPLTLLACAGFWVLPSVAEKRMRCWEP